ncbi:SHOCT domain-containing protein [Catenulispora pinisilvae]|uniref:SHOCT domain-containing protein n=1 Tax=Catenulispora pinisilvae TaxID=2705253 RepID=UPI001E41EB55|nr:SHOCT domain-containing protein [Catenulispora pinisilvae]
MMFGRPVVVRRGPGLLGAAARTAVVAGTASAVAGGVRRRQADRQAEAEPQAPPAPQAAAPAPGGDSIAELERLAALKQQGVLSDAEFAAAKAKVLGL